MLYSFLFCAFAYLLSHLAFALNHPKVQRQSNHLLVDYYMVGSLSRLCQMVLLLIWSGPIYVRQLGFLHYLGFKTNRRGHVSISTFQAPCLLMFHWSKQVTESTPVFRMEKKFCLLLGVAASSYCKGICIEEWEDFVSTLQSTKPL